MYYDIFQPRSRELLFVMKWSPTRSSTHPNMENAINRFMICSEVCQVRIDSPGIKSEPGPGSFALADWQKNYYHHGHQYNHALSKFIN